MKQINKVLTIALAALFTSLLAIAKTEVIGKMTYAGSAFSRSSSTVDATNPTNQPY